MNRLKDFFDIKMIKYSWLLVLSMIAFVAALYFDRAYFGNFPKGEMALFGTVFVIAFIWSILNYVGHLQLRSIYRKFDSIDDFIMCLSMEEEEKEELSAYLYDYVKDMEESGTSHEAAIKTAISQFQVKEITERDGNLFETKPHYYLLGYAAIFILVVVIIQGINTIVHLPFLILAVSFMLATFSCGFIGLFIIYKLLDVVLAKK